MPKCKFVNLTANITKTDPFMIIHASYLQKSNGEEKEITSIGLARRSESDKHNAGIAIDIAKFRAAKAIFYKLRGKKISHPLMG